MICSRASSKVADDGSDTIAIRGTMTSWTRRSPSSMTALIICSSSASRMPCSPPRSTIRSSSSAVIRASVVTSAPRRRAMVRVMNVRNATTGRKMRPMTSTGRARASENASGCASASDLGTSSPKTIVNSESRIVTVIRPMAPARSGDMPTDTSRSARRAARLTPAKADARKPMNVIASWMTARNRPGSLVRRRTRPAPRRPSSISWSTRLGRSETRAISAATKTPLRRTSRTMIPSSMRVSPIRPASLPRRVPTGPGRRPWAGSGVGRACGRASPRRACPAGRPA